MSWLQPPNHDRSPPETDIAVTLIDPCGGEPGTKASHDQCTQACNHSAINAYFCRENCVLWWGENYLL